MVYDFDFPVTRDTWQGTDPNATIIESFNGPFIDDFAACDTVTIHVDESIALGDDDDTTLDGSTPGEVVSGPALVLTIEPGEETVRLGGTVSLEAEICNEDRSECEPAREAKWSEKGKKAGTAIVTARQAGLTATAEIAVTKRLPWKPTDQASFTPALSASSTGTRGLW